MADTPGPDRWHLMSFPRSGNHLLRTLIEVMAARPTLGCPNNPKDTPIYQKVAARKTGSIPIRNPEPIGFKSHTRAHAEQHVENSPGTWGLIYLTRDPRAAIASHAARGKRGLKGRLPIINAIHKSKHVRHYANQYEATLDYFEDFAPNRRFHLRFEDLVDPQTRHATIAQLATVMDLQPPNPDTIDTIYTMAKSAQTSLLARRHGYKTWLARFVPRSLDYDLVQDRIATTGCDSA